VQGVAVSQFAPEKPSLQVHLQSSYVPATVPSFWQDYPPGPVVQGGATFSQFAPILPVPLQSQEQVFP
jgi:hypothetical protein